MDELHRDGTTLGLIHLCDRRDGDFSEFDEAVLAQLAQTASVAIENARLYEQMQRAVQVRDEVVGVVSHDLRNPLNALIMAATMAEQRADDAALVRPQRRWQQRWGSGAVAGWPSLTWGSSRGASR